MSTTTRPKLRESCDACAAAKVKCSKDHPQCKRCASSEKACIYGVSMKYGKLPKRRRTADDGVPPAASGVAPGRSILQRQINPATTQPDLNLSQELSPDEYFRGLVDNNGFNLWPTGAEMSTAWNPNNNSMQIDPASFTDPFNQPPPSSRSSYNDGDSSVPQSPRNRGVNTSATFPFMPTPRAPAPVSNGPSRAQMPQPMHNFAGCKSPVRQPSSATPGGIESKACQMRANSLLSYIHDCQTQPSVVPQSHESPNAMRSESSGRRSCINSVCSDKRSFDEILRTNRIAVRTVASLLECPCAREPHMAMLYTSITTRILASYQAMAGIKGQLSPVMTAGGTWSYNDPNTPTSSGAAASDASGVSTPTRYGTFSLEEEDHAMLQKALLLNELRKMAQLIDKMAPLGAKDEVQENEPRDGDVGDIYTKVCRWLRADVKRTMVKIKEGGGVMAHT